MTFASIRAAAQHIAREGTITPHQLAALSRLDELLTEAQKQEFTALWRAVGSPAGPVPEARSREQQQIDALAPLLALIRAGEGDYDSVNRGRAGDTPGGMPGLSGMRLSRVMDLQANGGLFAVGAYQFIPETLKMATNAARIGGDAVFTDATQDRLAVALLLGGKRPALRDYLTGKTNDLNAAQLDLAKEWASIPGPDGKGFYDGDSAGNRATAKASAVREALQSARRQLATAPAPKLELPAQQPAKPASDVLLTVPFFSQLDNASGQGERECASSSAAMVAAFWGKVKGDDAYNQIRQRFGDTTDVNAQVQALRSLGLDARFRTDGTPALLEAELRAGRPVMVGWLHKGSVSAPTGGGHYSVVIGCSALAWIHHDPNGEADLVNGGYVNHTKGARVIYSRKNWERRWRPDGNGWCLLVQPMG